MRRDGESLRLSATDIANALSCGHLTELDRAVAEGRMPAPAWRDPNLQLLRRRGMEHEAAYVKHLRAKGLEVVDLRGDEELFPLERTVAAMHAGAPVIVQAELADEGWAGRADLLVKVPEPSSLGGWSYEVTDTKLSQETRAGTVLQLCLYTDLVGKLQGRLPANMHVVKPGSGFTTEDFRFDDFGAYYRLVRRRLEEVVAAPPSESTYPRPVAHCDICRWRQACDARRHADDNLCLVAGIRPLHVDELERQGILTLRQFAGEPKAVREKPRRGSQEAFTRAHGQARVQLDGRNAGRPVHELLPAQPGFGLLLLPAPDRGDIFFDIESDPFAGDGGLEYLLGYAFMGDEGSLTYRRAWAFGPAQEREALEAFLDFVMERWQANGGMHIYHFSPYEPAAVKRLVGRHGTREEELDRLLRAERFVDLLAMTRQGLRVSVESYSLKSLESAFGFTRSMDLPKAGAALRRIAWALELAGTTEVSTEDRAMVEAYNRDDCLATAALRDWLEERRAELAAREGPIPRPVEAGGDASEAVEERAADVEEVFKLLTETLPEDRSAWGPEEHARWLLAHQLEYFRREEKSAWWDYFRIRGLEHEDLLDERAAVSGLRFLQVVEGAKGLVHRYSFPEQEAAFDPGDDLDEISGGNVGKVEALDLGNRTLDIARSRRTADHHPVAVQAYRRINTQLITRALLHLARSVAEHRVDGDGPYRAARDLLLQKPPRLRKPALGSLRKSGEEIVEAAVRLSGELDQGVLPIQGPPGSGKTWTGARMIAVLAGAGMRIGVTAVSHKVIRKLLDEAVSAAKRLGVPLAAAHKVREASGDGGAVEEVTDNPQARARLGPGRVVGGTVWLWSRDDMIESVDYLFVDEAGQLSLAHVLAAGRSAANIVLLGDPQQLEQPQRGAHPEGAEVAGLVHVLNRHKTMPPEAGLFLDETWRLHPDICAFTSELFYENRLHARPGRERQVLSGPTAFAGSGLFYVPVEHSGNQSSAPEEAAELARIARNLLSPGVTWTDAEGRPHPLRGSDILVVAPYNAQVAAIREQLPKDVRVGTVDKFQGQEAPVVIYSMTSSSAEDAPRGMGFLYNPNRLNVATSRAQCACILVCTRRLLEPDCGLPDQMRWANALCRYREMAREVSL